MGLKKILCVAVLGGGAFKYGLCAGNKGICI